MAFPESTSKNEGTGEYGPCYQNGDPQKMTFDMFRCRWIHDNVPGSRPDFTLTFQAYHMGKDRLSANTCVFPELDLSIRTRTAAGFTRGRS